MESLAVDDIGTRFKRLRQHFDITASELSDATGIALPNIRSIERGAVANPGVSIISKICRVYGVNANWLLLGEGELIAVDPDLERRVRQQEADLKDKDAIIQALNRALANLKGKLRRESQMPDAPDQPGLFSGFWPRQRLHAVTPRA